MYNDSYWFARLAFERALALIYLIAYVVAALQFTPLLGERGLLPVPHFLKRVLFRRSPSIFYLHYSDTFLRVVAWAGAALSLSMLLGLVERGPLWLPALVWFLLWVLYLSIVNVGQVFYSFGWESILLEAGFLAIFLGPASLAAPFVVMLLLRWVLFRVEFGAGLIKLRGDPCWRDLTCLDYHYETQPLPNPLSWYAHWLPKTFHRASVLFNHFTQLVVPWALFAPQPVASIAAALVIISQGWLILTGNYAWLNYLTMILALSGFSDGVLSSVLPLMLVMPSAFPRPPAFDAVLLVLAAATALLSIPPIVNMISPGQLMNFSFNPLHLVNTYGAFGSITKRRFEVIVEGTSDERPGPATVWQEYEFKGKPGDPHRRPPIVAPYHPRLDWQMWFLPFSPDHYPGWFLPFCAALLANDRQVMGLLRTNPFPAAPPRYVRARFFHYRFSTAAERKDSGQWWVRTAIDVYLPPVSLNSTVPGTRLRDSTRAPQHQP